MQNEHFVYSLLSLYVNNIQGESKKSVISKTMAITPLKSIRKGTSLPYFGVKLSWVCLMCYVCLEKKISYSYPKVTYSYPRVTYSDLQ